MMVRKTIETTFADILYNIDAIIHKTMDVKGDDAESPLRPYHIRTDDSQIDRSLLLRMMNARDATIRLILQAYLSQEDPRYRTNEEPELNDSYVYRLCVPETWPGALLTPLTTYIHDYIVRGTVYDYYMNVAPEYAIGTLPELTNLEEQIRSISMRRTGAVRRPLQPF